MHGVQRVQRILSEVCELTDEEKMVLETELLAEKAAAEQAWGAEVDHRATRMLAGETGGLRRDELRALLAMSPTEARARLASESSMTQRYLEVTFRKGKPLAAYLYLPRNGRVTVASTRDAGRGLKIDLDPAGTPIGVEITAPSLVSAADINAALAKFGAGAIDPAELAPLAA